MKLLAKNKNQNRHTVFWMTYAVLVLVTALLGGFLGVLFGYAIDLPRVSELQENQPSLVSYVYAQDGRIIGQFALEKRILISYDEIPENMKNAILAAEDAYFFRHSGIDFRAMFRTIINDIINWELKGGSTLTMQLAKMRFTSTEKTFERKIKDIFYALDIEKNYSKEQIFTFYANQIWMGHGRYGIAAAADFYFNKTLDDLTLAESALLAGIIQLPARYTPIQHPDRARSRRNWILTEMLDKGFITRDQFQQASEEPIYGKGRDDQLSPAPYFVEWVRQYLESQYQTDQIWQDGLRIYTTLDFDIQKSAQRALRNGLREFDRKKNGWRGAISNIADGEKSLEEYWDPDWSKIFFEGQMIKGLVLESNEDSAVVRFGTFKATIGPEDIAWTDEEKVNKVLVRGDLTPFTLVEVNRTNKTIRAELDQIPEVQGAVLALDNRTGAVRAMVGGFDFELSKFNRATQALRQPGSIFKPFTYIAAMEAGFSPNDQVLDSPVHFEDALGRPYEPTNWDDEYKGLITIRQALAESRNVPTVRLANALGPDKVAEMASRFGLKRDFPPFLSISLGSVEVTLEEIVSAFSAFPNHGVRAEPYFIDRVEDQTGSILEEHRPSIHNEVVSPEVADKMLYLMQEVVRSGSGRTLLELGHSFGGKTGTTNESTDTWFVGFTPSLTAGVWVGYDEKKSLGERVFGNTLALPIWKDFMQEVLADLPPERFDSNYRPEFAVSRIIDTDGGDLQDLPSEENAEPQPGITSFKVEDIAPPPPPNR
jgi:penicillin-binding protein 1A